MTKEAILMEKEDNVATIVSNLVQKGDMVDCEYQKTNALEEISFGHKIALEDIKKGEDIIKYNKVIGKATQNIKKGEHVHVHNVKGTK